MPGAWSYACISADTILSGCQVESGYTKPQYYVANDVMASNEEILHSNYYSGLNDEAKKRYAEKIKLIGEIDPYHRMGNRGKSTVSTIVEWSN